MKTSISIFVAFALLLTFSGCEQTRLGLFSRNPGSNLPDVVDDDDNTDGNRVLNRWTQPEPTLRPVDIFFITDASGSMDDERLAVAEALSNFLGTFEARGLDDYCISILRGVSGTETGDLYAKDFVDANKCLCSRQLSADQIQARFLASFGDNSMPDQDEGAACTLETGSDCTDGDPGTRCECTDGGEAGLYSFHKSFLGSLPKGSVEEQNIYESNRQLGCFRNNAAIAAIFVADENDLSTSPVQTPEATAAFDGHYSDASRAACVNLAETFGSETGLTAFDPSGPASVFDLECMEMGGRYDYYANPQGVLTRTPETILSDMLISQGLSPFVSAVVGYVDESTFVPSGENEFPYGYAELVEAAGGDFVDITLTQNQTQFNQAFTELGTNLSQQATLITVFDLSSPACTSTLTVTVDDNDVTPYIKMQGNQRFTIAASHAGSVGSVIEARFEICE